MVKEELLKDLSNPNVHRELGVFPKWKPNSNLPGGKMEIVPYYDDAQIQIILDNIIGIINWQSETRNLNGKIYCAISINTDEGWIFKDNAGGPREVPEKKRVKMTEIELNEFYTKTEATSAFVRAASRWGIGIHLENLPSIALEKGGSYNTYKTNKGEILHTTEQLSAYCNGMNTSQWLLTRLYYDKKNLFESNSRLKQLLSELSEGFKNV